MRRDQDDRPPPAAIVLEPPSKLESALAIECDVDEEDIGPKPLSSLKRLRRRQGHAHDLQALAFEQNARGRQKGGVVIHDEHTHRHAESLAPEAPPGIAASRKSSHFSPAIPASGQSRFVPAGGGRCTLALMTGGASSEIVGCGEPR